MGKSLCDIDASAFPPLRSLVLRRQLIIPQDKPLKSIGVAWQPNSNAEHLVSIDQAGAVVLWAAANKRVMQFISKNRDI